MVSAKPRYTQKCPLSPSVNHDKYSATLFCPVFNKCFKG